MFYWEGVKSATPLVLMVWALVFFLFFEAKALVLRATPHMPFDARLGALPVLQALRRWQAAAVLGEQCPSSSLGLAPGPPPPR